MVETSAPYISRLINKKDGIVNKVFVEMLEKLGYDIQISYKEGRNEMIVKNIESRRIFKENME